jgi:hypothetical protein
MPPADNWQIKKDSFLIIQHKKALKTRFRSVFNAFFLAKKVLVFRVYQRLSLKVVEK